jgi:hypothetical protein
VDGDPHHAPADIDPRVLQRGEQAGRGGQLDTRKLGITPTPALQAGTARHGMRSGLPVRAGDMPQ